MSSYRPNGAKIKSLRKAKKLSQEAVAALSESLPRPYGSVSDRTLRTAERETGRISEEQLKAIAAVLETDFEDIIIPDPVTDPFRGLQSYGPEDRTILGGRDAFISRGIDMLQNNDVALVIGPSGSGKSSLCYAGIVPAILEANEQTALISFRPGTSALDALSNALCSTLIPSDSAAKTAETLRETRDLLENNDHALSDIITAAHIRHSADNILIYIDQGEELCTQTTNADTLLRQLNIALERHAPSVKLLISVRSDYIGVLTHLDGDFFKRFDHATLVLRRMSNDELRDAIMRPMRELDVPHEEQFVDALIKDARDQEGYLPHIQFVLSELWNTDLPQKSRLTLDRYFEIGRLPGVIARHASKIYGQLSTEDQTRAKDVLPRLVTSTAPGRDVEARKPLNTFTTEAQNLILRLAAPDARILSIDEEEIVGFAHEEIIRQWQELRLWLMQEGEDARQREMLERDIAAWVQHNESRDYLVPGGQRLNKYKTLLEGLPEVARPVRGMEFIEQSKKVHSLFNRYAARASVFTAAFATIVLLSFWAYSSLSTYFKEKEQKEALANVLQISKSKDQKYMSNRNLYFPDWPTRRFALYKEISHSFKKFYAFKAEATKVHDLLDSCHSLKGIPFNNLSLNGVSFRHYSKKCGYSGVSTFRTKFSILTSIRLPEDFIVTRGLLVGSFLNRIDFKNTDLNGTYMPCSVIDKSNFTRVQNFSPSQIENSFCLYARTGPPRLPKGWQQPPGCKWMEDLKKKYGWKNYSQAKAPKTLEESIEIKQRQSEVVEKFYYQCIKQENAYELADSAFQFALTNQLDKAKVKAKKAMNLSEASYVKLKTAPVFALAGNMQQARKNYLSLKGVFDPRWGNFSHLAITDITTLTEAGHKGERLKEIKRSLIDTLYNKKR